MIHELPEPALRRWQPLRAGLVDLFYYDSEEFRFRDGRLLLRGNNGTGKSKVLALMLPFLLDGDLSAHRVEPDADPKKKMEWNLLLGGAHPHPERLGYTWLEFGRLDEAGSPIYCTIGCGMKAVSGRGIARHWYFVTEQRVGEDFDLIDATGTALSRERLVDALGERGAVHDRARDYRRVVDETLFGFGEQRYSALVDLLVQLRQPQLSKRPSEKVLSAALTEALPPPDQAVIADVAEAFRSLEQDRDALSAMAEAHESATSFLAQYGHYARIAAFRRADLPRKAQAGYERVNRQLGAVQEELTEADRKLQTARDRESRLDTERNRLQGRDQALRASPDMRSAQELERVAAEAGRCATEARRIGVEREEAVRRCTTQRERHRVAANGLTTARDQLTAARTDASANATQAALATEHADSVERGLDNERDRTALREDAETLADRQERAIKVVTELIQAADTATRTLAGARQRVSDLDTETDDLAQRRAAGDRVVQERGAALVSAVRGHLDGAVELRLADSGTTLAELELWVETLDGPNPAVGAVQAAGQDAAGELARADARLGTRQDSENSRKQQLDSEIARLERGEDEAPPAPHTRNAVARQDRPGAPLWQLAEFADGVPDTDKAGLEAALEAAGVLDAWVTPDGHVLSPDVADVLLRPDESAPVNLASVLRPAVDRGNEQAAAVSDDAVTTALATIGLGEHGHTWVARDGRFRIGALEGSWHKPRATYIGRGAREAARRARLAELRAEQAEVAATLAKLETDRETLAGRSATLTREIEDLPREFELQQAHAHVASLIAEQRRLDARRERATEVVTEATTAEAAAQEALHAGAGDAGLPADAATLSAVHSAVGRYRVSLAGLWPAVDALAESTAREREAADDLAQAETAQDGLAERATQAEQVAATAEERHQTLQSTVGAAVAELERRLAEVTELLRDNESERNDAAREAGQALEARGAANGRKNELTQQLETATAERAEAAEKFRRFATTGLLGVALPELEFPDPDSTWAPDPTARLARRVHDELADVAADDTSWDRAQYHLNNELKTLHDTLSRHGNRASADPREDGVIVEIEFQGRRSSVPQLADALAAEVAERDRLLTEREREILENHLINEVASTLQELISAAETQVRRLNEELDSRPTSTGMRLRLLWQPREDGPAGLNAARERLLRQTSDAWSEQDRAAIGDFLQARIAEVRASDTAGTWLEHLTRALDYRQWNRFVIQRHQNDQWRAATGPASGGERVLAASVPLFAAASSHYASAGNPHAPRLVTLDEAFAGVDDNARAKYFGLLAAFDLDVVMTSEREWGCYQEVPGLAISQLSRTDDVPAVLVTNWEWDGHKRNRVDHRPRKVAAAEPTSIQDGLWA